MLQVCCVKLNSPVAAGDFPRLRQVVLFGCFRLREWWCFGLVLLVS